MGKKRGSKRGGKGGGAKKPVATSSYTDEHGNILTLRNELSAGTLRGLEQVEAKPAASIEDRWQRKVEYLFERLTVGWEIAGLPLDGQKELLGRFRMASTDERRAVRDALEEHLREHIPELKL